MSQSVEQDHPYAFDFLRADITHIDDYFKKKGNVKTLGLRKTFEWIVRPPSRSEDNVETANEAHDDMTSASDIDTRQLNSLQMLASGPFTKVERVMRPPGESEEELTKEALLLIEANQNEITTEKEKDLKEGDQAVFRQAYIPQTLNEVFDPERDIEKRNQGNGDDLIYSNVIGMESREVESVKKNETNDAAENDSSSTTASESDSEEEGQGDDVKQKTPRGHRHEDRDAKKVSDK